MKTFEWSLICSNLIFTSKFISHTHTHTRPKIPCQKLSLALAEPGLNRKRMRCNAFGSIHSSLTFDMNGFGINIWMITRNRTVSFLLLHDNSNIKWFGFGFSVIRTTDYTTVFYVFHRIQIEFNNKTLNIQQNVPKSITGKLTNDRKKWK